MSHVKTEVGDQGAGRGVNWRKVGRFLALAIGIDWAIVVLYLGLGGQWNSHWTNVVLIGYMFVPALAAVLVQRAYGGRVRGPLGVSFRLNRWFLVAWFLPLLLVLGSLAVSLLVPGVSYSPGMEGMFERYREMLTPEQMDQMRAQLRQVGEAGAWFMVIAPGLLARATVNAVAAFGEELGWRGFLQREFAGLGFWRGSLLTGVIWGLWHAPVILQGHNFPQHPVIGVFVMTLAMTLLAPIIGWVRLRARSVLAAAVAHGTLNATAGLAILFVRGGNDLTTGVTGLPGLVVLFVADLGVYLFERFRAAEPPAV